MNKFRNKGVSFFELVIAVAIFGILVIPITSQLIQALKTSEKSSVAQSKYEFAENLMENIKNVNMDTFLSEKMKSDEYLQKVSSGSSIKRYPDTGMYTTTLTDGGNSAEYNGCILTGETEVGTGSKAKKCYYAVLADNKAYAQKSLKDANYSNPNDSTLAMIESLDSSKVAVIDGSIGNYDNLVTNTYMSKKLDLLKIGDKTRWEQYTKQQADIVAFPNDKAVRIIQISVKSEEGSKTGEMKYTVECKLRYKDQSNVVLKEGPHQGDSLGSLLPEVDYTPYTQTFEASDLPSIYLMYNPCLYNNSYMDNDYIILDTSGLQKQEVDALDENGKAIVENGVTKKEQGYPQVNLFVVETSEKFSDQAAQSYALVTVAQNAAETQISDEAKALASQAANAVNPDKKSDEWQVTYDKKYDEEYERIKKEKYDTLYANVYKSVSDAVSKNDSSNAYKTQYDTAYNEYKNKSLISTSSVTNRKDAKVHFIGKKAIGAGDTDKYVHVYHNFMDQDYNGADKRTSKDNIVLTTGRDPITPMRSQGMYCLDTKQVNYITEAITKASPLYDVKVYVSDEPIVTGSGTTYQALYDKLTVESNGYKPALSGTKGGN